MSWPSERFSATTHSWHSTTSSKGSPHKPHTHRYAYWQPATDENSNEISIAKIEPYTKLWNFPPVSKDMIFRLFFSLSWKIQAYKVNLFNSWALFRVPLALGQVFSKLSARWQTVYSEHTCVHIDRSGQISPSSTEENCSGPLRWLENQQICKINHNIS